MKAEPTSIPDVKLIKADVFNDARGSFHETWSERRFAEAGIETNFVQDNFSESSQHTLRGLHYQIEQAQGKLVRVAYGKVFDVAVDIRKSSPYFGRWVGVELSHDNKHALWIPPGFAHGFLVLSKSAIFEYKCSDYYAPEHERTILWDDPDIGVVWPLPSGMKPVLSGKDAAGSAFSDADTYS